MHFNLVHASSALKASTSVCADTNRARVEDTHLLQCLRSKGGISEEILKRVLFAFLILSVISLRALWDSCSLTVANFFDLELQFLQQRLPLAARFSLPQSSQHPGLPKSEVALITFALSDSLPKRIWQCVFRWSMKVDLAYPRPPKFLQPVTGHMYRHLWAIFLEENGFGDGVLVGIGFFLRGPTCVVCPGALWLLVVTCSGLQLIPQSLDLLSLKSNGVALLFSSILSASVIVTGCE